MQCAAEPPLGHPFLWLKLFLGDVLVELHYDARVRDSFTDVVKEFQIGLESLLLVLEKKQRN